MFFRNHVISVEHDIMAAQSVTQLNGCAERQFGAR